MDHKTNEFFVCWIPHICHEMSFFSFRFDAGNASSFSFFIFFICFVSLFFSLKVSFFLYYIRLHMIHFNGISSIRPFNAQNKWIKDYENVTINFFEIIYGSTTIFFWIGRRVLIICMNLMIIKINVVFFCCCADFILTIIRHRGKHAYAVHSYQYETQNVFFFFLIWTFKSWCGRQNHLWKYLFWYRASLHFEMLCSLDFNVYECLCDIDVILTC